MEDKNRDIKEWLRRPRKIWSEVTVLRDQIENLRLMMELPKGISYDGVKVQTSPQDPMANFAAKLDEFGRELKEKLEEYEKAFDEIDAVIKAVENTDARVILTKRYVRWEKWAEIEEETPFCLRQIQRKHRIGLQAIRKILEG